MQCKLLSIVCGVSSSCKQLLHIFHKGKIQLLFLNRSETMRGLKTPSRRGLAPRRRAYVDACTSTISREVMTDLTISGKVQNQLDVVWFHVNNI